MTSLRFFPALALTTLVTAQTITNGPATYTQSPLPTSQQVGVSDHLNGGGGDVLYQHWWWFRVAGDSREWAFRNDGSATRVVHPPGSGMTTTWLDVDSRGLFGATLTQDLSPVGAAGARLHETMTIRNLTAGQLDIDLFSMVDFDVQGQFNDQVRGNLETQVFADPTATEAAEFRAVGAAVSLAVPTVALRFSLQNSVVDDFSGWNGTTASGDCTGLFQFTLHIPPNGTATVVDDLISMSCGPWTEWSGVASVGSLGLPQISSDFPVLRSQTSTFDIELVFARPNSIAMLLLNTGPASQLVSGLRIQVEPVGASTVFVPTTATGTATYALALPGNPAFCASDLYGQWLVLDPLATGGLAAHTTRVRMTLGAW